MPQWDARWGVDDPNETCVAASTAQVPPFALFDSTALPPVTPPANNAKSGTLRAEAEGASHCGMAPSTLAREAPIASQVMLNYPL